MSRPTTVRVLLAIFGGLLAGLSVPPTGWAPIAPVGIACMVWATGTLSPRARFVGGWLAGCALFALTLTFTAHFTLVGAVVLIGLEAFFVAIPLWVAGFTRTPIATAALALVVAEALRQRVPFGGLPIGSLSLSTSEGPWRGFARVAGPLGLYAVVVFVAGATAWLATAVAVRDKRAGLICTLALLGLVTAPLPLGALAGSGLHTTGALSVTCAQGGGTRGLSQFQVNPDDVFAAQVRISSTLRPGPVPSIVLWPENTVAVDQPFESTTQFTTIANIATTLRSTVIVGVRTDLSTPRFLNQAVAIGPLGHIVGVVTKVHRVPFGEYVPFRKLLAHVANLAGVPRDAVVGTGPPTMSVAHTTVGILISYETFYASRAREAARDGATLLLAPTNTASYASDQVPDQQLAAAQLDATSTGRALVLCAPTGRSAVINRSGAVLARTAFSSPAVLSAMVEQSTGSTIYDITGDVPLLVVCAGGLVVVGLRRRQS